MNKEDIQITPTVLLSQNEVIYIIYKNDEPFAYTKKKINAKILMNDIADQLEMDLRISGKRIFRENEDDCIKISRQTINGFLGNGSVSLKYILELRPLGKLFRINNPPTPPPAPNPPTPPPPPQPPFQPPLQHTSPIASQFIA